MHHLTCEISSLLHSVNLILFTVILVHLILRISPHHSHHLRCHHHILPPSFTPDLKLISFRNPFLHSLSGSWIGPDLTGTGVCFSFFFHFYRAMHFSAKRGIAIACRLSVRPSVRLSVTLVDCDHIGWNSSKISTPLVSLGRSLVATPT